MSTKFFIFVTSIILFHWRFEVTASCPGIPDTSCTCSSKAPKMGKGTAVKLQMKCTQIEGVEDLSFLKTFGNNITIGQLDLSHNYIKTLPFESFPLTKLNKLDLSFNDIHQIEKGALSKLKNLKNLILSNNKLKAIDRDMFEGLQSLENLDLGNNVIHYIGKAAFSSMKNLKFLTLSNNNLDKLDTQTFEGLHNLENLKLAKNNLTTLPAADAFPQNLSFLDISGNAFVCTCEIWWLRLTHIEISEPRPTCTSPISQTQDSITRISTMYPCTWDTNAVPKLYLDPNQDQIVFEGDSLLLLCRVDDYPETKHGEELLWRLEGQDPIAAFPASVRNHYDKNGGYNNSLIIENIEEKHAGEWSCNFISPGGNKSQSVTVVVIPKRAAYCEITVSDTNKGRYVWPETISGRKVNLPCELEDKNQFQSYATYACSSNGTWVDLNTNNCPYTSNVTRILQESSKMNLTYDKTSLIESAVSLRNFTSENIQNIVNVIDFHYIVTTIENYLPYLEKERELDKYLLEIVNCALKLPREIMEKAQQEYNACTRLINANENILKYSSTSDFHNDELIVKVIPLSSGDFNGMTCSWVKGLNGVLDSVNCSFTNKTMSRGQDIEASIQLPPSLFDSTELETSHSTDYQLMVVMFKDNRLFPDKNIYKESSSVFAMNLLDLKIEKLEKPLHVRVKNYNFNAPKLAWWDMEFGLWRSEGCRALTVGGIQSWLTFQCNQLGYFSLFNDQDDNAAFYEKEKPVFNFLHPSIYVGTFVSVTCLLLASATYCFCYSHIQMSKKMKHSLANTWLSTSLFFLMFSVGIHQTEQDKFCKVIGLSIHYFVLATLFWMAVTIKALYKRVQKSNPSVSTPSEDLPADVNIQKPILGIYLVGWGISSIICGIAGAVNIRGYSSPRYCFLTPGPELSTVLIPASLVLFYLLIMCLLVKCATGSPDSNPQLSVGTQAIDLELLDGGGRNSFTQERCSVRSITTPSSQAEDTEHSAGRQLKAFVIYLVLYLLATVCAAFCVMLPLKWPYEEKIFSFTYAFVCFLLGSFVIFFHCFARNDIRSSWSDVLRASRFGKSPHIIANSLIPPVSFRPDSNDPVSGVISKPASVEENFAKTEFQKQTPNVNLVRLHRQHYRGCNTTEADNFYNPHQSIVAKKFFKKQRRKRNTLQVRKCRSGGSSPVSAGIFEDSAKATGTRTDDENTKFLSNSNEQYDEFSSEKHPLTYDEPDITGCEGKTGTESEATFTVPEYAEIQEHSLKYAAPPYKTETKEQMCGTSDRDWCSCDAISDVNSEPTYNYAYIKNGYESSRSVMSDNSSVNSHLYTAVAPDVVSSSMDRHRRRFNYRPPPRTSYRNGRVNVHNGNFNCPPSTVDFKRRRKDILYKIPKEANPVHFGTEADKVETCVIRTTHYPDIV